MANIIWKDNVDAVISCIRRNAPHGWRGRDQYGEIHLQFAVYVNVWCPFVNLKYFTSVKRSSLKLKCKCHKGVKNKQSLKQTENKIVKNEDKKCDEKVACKWQIKPIPKDLQMKCAAVGQRLIDLEKNQMSKTAKWKRQRVSTYACVWRPEMWRLLIHWLLIINVGWVQKVQSYKMVGPYYVCYG